MSDIDKRIAEEQAKIVVPSYRDVTWDNSWKRRAGALWAVGSVGMVAGAWLGATTPFFPVLLAGVAPSAAIAALPASIAIFAAAGITAGMGIGVIMGPTTGAASAAIQEFERRQIARDVEEKIRENPDAEVKLIRREPIPPRKEQSGFTLSNYYNLKSSLLFAAIGAMAGLVFAAALSASGGLAGPMAKEFIMPAVNFLVGKLGATAATTPAIVTAYSVGVGTMFGAQFGVSYSLITRKAVNFANDLLSGKLLGDPWPRKTNVPSVQPVLSPVVVKHPEIEEAVAQEQPKFAEKVQRAPNYEKLVAQSIKEAESCYNVR